MEARGQEPRLPNPKFRPVFQYIYMLLFTDMCLRRVKYPRYALEV